MSADDTEKSPQERRKSARLDVDLPVNVKLPNGGTAKIRTKNFSLGGLCVTGMPTWQADVGDVLELSVEIPEYNITINVAAVIQWRDQQSKLIGLMFRESPDALLTKIRKVMEVLDKIVFPT